MDLWVFDPWLWVIHGKNLHGSGYDFWGPKYHRYRSGSPADPLVPSPIQMLDPHKPFVVESDASKFASGAVLRQQDTNGDWHPCSYLSQSFNATEQNYKIYDRELLAIIWALTEWCHYLLGSPHPVTVLSDHKNLTYFWTAQKLN